MTTFATPRPSTVTDEAAWPAETLSDCPAQNQPLNCWQLGDVPWLPRRPLARCSVIVVEAFDARECA